MLAFAEVSLSPARFEAMPAHDKTVLALLVQERGLELAPYVARHAEKRHAFALQKSQSEAGQDAA